MLIEQFKLFAGRLSHCLSYKSDHSAGLGDEPDQTCGQVPSIGDAPVAVGPGHHRCRSAAAGSGFDGVAGGVDPTAQCPGGHDQAGEGRCRGYQDAAIGAGHERGDRGVEQGQAVSAADLAGDSGGSAH